MLSSNVRLRLLVDMDGVVADFVGKIISLYNHNFNDSLLYEDIKHYDLLKTISHDRHHFINDIMDSKGFFNSLDVIPGAIEAIEDLYSKGHEIVFVTVAPKTSETAAYDKYLWLKDKFSFIKDLRDNIVFAKNKSLVLGHVLFDDGPLNIERFNKVGGLTCVMDHPWNKETKSSFRVSSWDEFKKVVEYIQAIVVGAKET